MNVCEILGFPGNSDVIYTINEQISINDLIGSILNIKTLENIHEISEIQQIRLEGESIYHVISIRNIYNYFKISLNRLNIDSTKYIDFTYEFTTMCLRAFPKNMNAAILFNAAILCFDKDLFKTHEFAIRADERGYPGSSDLLFLINIRNSDPIRLIIPPISLAINLNLCEMWLKYLENLNLLDILNWYSDQFQTIRNNTCKINIISHSKRKYSNIIEEELNYTIDNSHYQLEKQNKK